MSYLAAVRHPWPCLVFLVPLLAGYEIGVARLDGTTAEPVRAGVDLWIRHWLAENGVTEIVVAPGALLLLLAFWSIWQWKERPERVFTAVFGIVLEGVLFGLGLWMLCANAPAIFAHFGLPLAALGANAEAKAVTFVGVGIYEEVVFRLVLFAGLARLINFVLVPKIVAVPMALIASSAVFALAHHWVQTDPFLPAVFLTRLMIGAYCALLYWWRGIGVAVGAHIVYDLVVGL